MVASAWCAMQAIKWDTGINMTQFAGQTAEYLLQHKPGSSSAQHQAPGQPHCPCRRWPPAAHWGGQSACSAAGGGPSSHTPLQPSASRAAANTPPAPPLHKLIHIVAIWLDLLYAICYCITSICYVLDRLSGNKYSCEWNQKYEYWKSWF